MPEVAVDVNLRYPVGTYLWYSDDAYCLHQVGRFVWIDTEYPDEDWADERGDEWGDVWFWNRLQSGELDPNIRLIDCAIKRRKYEQLVAEATDTEN